MAASSRIACTLVTLLKRHYNQYFCSSGSSSSSIGRHVIRNAIWSDAVARIGYKHSSQHGAAPEVLCCNRQLPALL